MSARPKPIHKALHNLVRKIPVHWKREHRSYERLEVLAQLAANVIITDDHDKLIDVFKKKKEKIGGTASVAAAIKNIRNQKRKIPK